MRAAPDVSGPGNAFDASHLSSSAPRASQHRRGRLAAAALLVAGLLACPLLFERRSAASNPDETDALWVAHSQGVAALALPDASVLLELTDLVDARAVALDSRRQRVWVYAPGMLRATSPTGQVLLSAPVPPAGTKADRAALCVTGDGAVWIAVGTAAHQFTDSGQIAATVTLAEEVRSAEADLPRGTLWIGSDETLTAFDAAAGTPLHVIDLGRKAGLTDLAVDAGTGEAWVATKDAVRRYAVTGELVLQVDAKKIERIAADELGGAWGLTDKELLRLTSAGAVALRVTLPHGDGKAAALTPDPADGSMWAASDRAVYHYSAAGALLAARDFKPDRKDVRDLALSSDSMPPEIEIVAPAGGVSLRDPAPEITVRYADAGSGVDPATLAFTANGDDLEVACTTTEAGATCVPSSPLADGPVTLLATVHDRAGNASEPATVAFTVDTVDPAITITSHADGALTNQRAHLILGYLSEDAALAVNATPVAVDPDLAFAVGPVTLTEGLNTFAFAATDPAGNTADLALTLVLDTVPPAAVEAAKVTVTAPDGGEVDVIGAAGAAEAASLVTITNAATTASVVATAGTDGSFVATLAAGSNDTLSLAARDAAGNTGAAVQIAVPGGLPPDPATVAPPLDPTVPTDLYAATSFLYTGTDPIQTGVAPGTIEPRRVCVLRGRVLGRDGQPIPGVAITVHGHPEYGQTLSRADGRYDLAVNGGGPLTVSYAKPGHLSVVRHAGVDWREWLTVDDVVLVPFDPVVSVVDLTQPVVQVARGSVATDASGTRQATLLFNPGTTATMVLPDGTQQALTTLHVRATEYTVGPNGPRAMPAPLPANVAYTYCVELSADEEIASGSNRIDFSQPLIQYVENFLGLPVGASVPLGWFDRTKGVWLPADNGQIVQILSVNAGMADLDLDGSGIAASAPALAALGITDGERQQLAVLYQPGQSLWRVAIPHFMAPWDVNWPFSMPDDATTFGKAWTSGNPDSCSACGSVVEIQAQTLGESVPLAGTPFSLNYRSSRAPGWRAETSIEVELSPSTVPATLKRIELELAVAGRHVAQTFTNAPNQRTTLHWDGNDAYGRAMSAGEIAIVEVGYVYDGVYQQNNRFGYSGNGIPITGSFTRQEVTMWTRIPLPLQNRAAAGGDAGGWTLDVHHTYDPTARVVHLGNGTRQHAGDLRNGVIKTVAGNGESGFSGDGGPATAARLNRPTGVAVGEDGSVYISDSGNCRIRKVDANGIITTSAGTGSCSYWGDGVPATSARLNSPSRISIGPGGSLYIAAEWDDRVRVVDRQGIIRTLATVPYHPQDVAPGPDGTTYVSRHYQSTVDVQRLGPDGVRTTALTWWVDGLDWLRDGTLALSVGTSVRGLRRDGSHVVIAGDRCAPGIGDGYPAACATVSPRDVAEGPNGLLIADGGQYRIRRIDSNGIISTFAGTGENGYDGEGSPATGSRINHVPALATGPDGSVYFAEWYNNRVRRIAGALPGFSGSEIVVAADNGGEVFVFDAQGRHLRTLDAATGIVLLELAYDAAGHPVSVTDRDGAITRIERDGAATATAIVAPDGQRTQLETDAAGHLSKVTNPAGESTAFETSPDGLLSSLTDARGNTTTFAYDELGRLVRDEDPSGGFLQLARSQSIDVLEVTKSTAEGRATTYTIQTLPDGRERRTVVDAGCACSESETVSGPDGSRTTTARDGTVSTQLQGPDPRFGMQAPIVKSATVTTPSGLRSSTTASRTVTLSNPADPMSLQSQTDTVTVNGRTSTTVLNAASRTITTTSPAGRTSVTTLDTKGRPVTEQVGGLTPISYDYDGRGRLSTVTQGDRSSTLTYDARGNLDTITDPAGRVTAFDHDLAGRVLTQTLPDGRVIGFGTDPDGNVTSITPPGRPSHGFTYTPVNLQETYTPPDLGLGPTSTTYGYNLDKQLTTITRPDGQGVVFGYDTQGRLGTITAPHGVTTLTYDPTTGTLTGMTTPDGQQLSYTHDGFLETGVTWAGAVAGSVIRAYNVDFRVTETKVNGALPVSYAYDNDGLLTGAGGLTVTRDPLNGLVTGTAIGAVTDSHTTNGFGESTGLTATVSGSPVLSTSFTRDSLGRISRKVETFEGQTTTFDYTYDAAGRLWQVVKTPQGGSPITTTYGYDANGNRLSKTDQTDTITGTHDDQDRLLTYGDTSFTYNANGDLTSKTQNGATVTYDSDVFGNLRHVTLDNGIEIDYVIDGRNRRIGKKVNGTLVQGFLYNDQLRVAAELDGSNAVVSRFVYGTHVNVPELIVKGATTYRIVHDHLGSPRLVINTADGSIAQRMDFDEFGIVTLDTNPGFQPFGFAGGLYDPHTRLVRFGARDYDAPVGRWTAKDPILFHGGDLNIFRYCYGDPVNHIDAYGRGIIDCLLIPVRCNKACRSWMDRCWKEHCDPERCLERGEPPEVLVDMSAHLWAKCYTKECEKCLKTMMKCGVWGITPRPI